MTKRDFEVLGTALAGLADIAVRRQVTDAVADACRIHYPRFDERRFKLFVEETHNELIGQRKEDV